MEKLQRLKSSLEEKKTELAIKKSERANLKEKLKENYGLDSGGYCGRVTPKRTRLRR
ncbi:hypothetical protein LCGC14_1938160 [marine sediment metagenome]|uniref:Uncharacterized protein n=1 Tax=marine sediment metagenome TaxID=412755 RepID=A0A0F9IIF9_9ZZZZ